jgi:hypothetical protein
MLRRSIWFTLTILLVGLVLWQPPTGRTMPFFCGGTASFSNGPYDWINSTFYYSVTGAPANVCGTLHTLRNGSQLDSPGWICTNSSGNATMGPYSGSSNQTDENIYIEWPNGCTTTGATRHVSDASAPNITIDNCCHSAFGGSLTDTQWGTGFDFGPFGWSGITTTYQDLSSGLFWNGSAYNSSSQLNFSGFPSDYFGFNLTWTSSPPPPSAHDSSHSYRWCVVTRDFFYQSNIACTGFNGVP